MTFTREEIFQGYYDKSYGAIYFLDDSNRARVLVELLPAECFDPRGEPREGTFTISIKFSPNEKL